MDLSASFSVRFGDVGKIFMLTDKGRFVMPKTIDEKELSFIGGTIIENLFRLAMEKEIKQSQSIKELKNFFKKHFQNLKESFWLMMLI